MFSLLVLTSKQRLQVPPAVDHAKNLRSTLDWSYKRKHFVSGTFGGPDLVLSPAAQQRRSEHIDAHGARLRRDAKASR